MGDPVTVGLGVVGTGVSIYGQIKSANDKADAAWKEAANKRVQAKQVLQAGQREQDLLQIRGQRALGDTAQAYAASGVEMSGTPLLQMEDIAQQVTSESIALEHSTKFRADQLNAGADLEQEQSRDIRDAGLLGAIGTGLQGAGRGYSLADPNSKKVNRIGGL